MIELYMYTNSSELLTTLSISVVPHVDKFQLNKSYATLVKVVTEVLYTLLTQL